MFPNSTRSRSAAYPPRTLSRRAKLYVVPRIADLPDIEDFLKTHVPEASYVIAHGQLAAGDLDERMNQFYDGKYDVLLATTIVESGLDIPTANTMIVHRADM